MANVLKQVVDSICDDTIDDLSSIIPHVLEMMGHLHPSQEHFPQQAVTNFILQSQYPSTHGIDHVSAFRLVAPQPHQDLEALKNAISLMNVKEIRTILERNLSQDHDIQRIASVVLNHITYTRTTKPKLGISICARGVFGKMCDPDYSIQSDLPLGMQIFIEMRKGNKIYVYEEVIEINGGVVNEICQNISSLRTFNKNFHNTDIRSADGSTEEWHCQLNGLNALLAAS